MKLVAMGQSRSIWLFPLVEFNPNGLSLMPCLQFLLDRYKFLKFPAGEELRTQQQYKFEDGVFIDPDGQQLWVNLSVYSDGVVADTRASTEDSDSFLHELLTSLSQDFGFVPYEKIIRRKAYSSEVFVEMDEGFSALNQRLKSFLRELQANVASDNTIPLEVAGITFQQDPAKLNGMYPFKFERANNAPYKDKRYYSLAPMSTQIHKQMIEKLEAILLGRSI